MSIYSVHLIDLLLAQLSPREHEVKHFIAMGYANKNIAAELDVSQRTVEAHRANIFRKLGVRNAVDLVNVLRAHAERAPQVAEPIQPFGVEQAVDAYRVADSDTDTLVNKESEQEKSANDADSEESPS